MQADCSQNGQTLVLAKIQAQCRT